MHLSCNATRALFAFVALFGGPSSSAGVLIVSPLGPYSQIGNAVVAASEGDVVLVRTGQYFGFTVNDKGLWIVADAGASVKVTTTITINQLGAGKTLVLRGIDAASTGAVSTSTDGLRVIACSGEVRLEDSSFIGRSFSLDAPGTSGAVVEDCRSVAFLRSTLIGGDGGSVADGVPAIAGSGGSGLAASHSIVAMYDSTCRGGAGGHSAGSAGVGGGEGGAGAAIVAESLFASGSEFHGGAGGNGGPSGTAVNCGSGGDGGDGLFLGESARARLRDSSCSPGPGGAAGCAQAPDGVDGIAIDQAGGFVVPLAGTARHLAGTSPVREGDSVAYVLEGGANEPVLVQFSASAASAYLPGNGGVLLLGPPQTLFASVLDATGSLVHAIPVPPLGPGILDSEFHVQGYFTEPSGNAVLSPATGIVLLDLSFPAPAANDECVTAAPLQLGLTTGSNANASPSLSGSGACPAISNDIWYAYEAPVTGTLEVGFCAPGAGASFDTLIALFGVASDGSCLSIPIDCNDDACGTAAALSKVLLAGEEIRVKVGSKVGAKGTFTLHAAFHPAPANDVAADAISVGEGLIGGSNGGDMAADPLVGSCGGTKDVWYSYVPSATGAARVGFCAPGAGAGFDPILTVFSDAYGPMAQVACDDDRCGALPEVVFPVVAGQRCLLRVASKTAAAGAFTLAIECHPAAVRQTELLGVASPTGSVSTLVRINTFPWKLTTVGSTGVGNLRTLDIDPASGQVFAASSPFLSFTNAKLYTVNPATGLAATIGTASALAISGIAFDAGGGLYGSATVTASLPFGSLVALNPTTAATAVIGTFDPAGLVKGVQGLAFDPTSGKLYGSTGTGYDGPPGDLFTIDTATGLASPAGSLAERHSAAPAPASVSGFAIDAVGDFYGSLGPQDGRVLVIDRPTLTYVVYGDAETGGIDGLTAPCPGNELYGKGCAGAGGFTPLLALSGCTRQGSTVTLSLRNALGGSTALLVFGLVPATLPISSNCTLNVAPLLPGTVALPLPGSGPGQGAIEVTVRVPLVSSPLDLTLQALVADPTVPNGVVSSNGLALEVR